MAASGDHVGGDPPESMQLRLGDDIAWSEINGVYDRDDSLKENTNPKSVFKNHPGAVSGGSSQRFSGNLKPTAAPIIGLSRKLGGSVRRHQHPPAMFPKKAKTGGGGRAPKAAVPEPGSPKVSCIGKVLSDRERARLGHRPPRGGARAPGCCGGLGLLMRRSRSRHSGVVECVDQSPPFPPLADVAPRRREVEAEEEEEEEVTVAEPALAPGLGGVRRFASGRRAAEWAAQMEDDGHVARSGPL
ncbi:uncharacterized protein LOC8066975 [Sorghum bicolor]|uniref:Uncharacterized protein n=1 Tax=Sorghum bicolor TaxID=4558 RepID=C5YRT3_SORBI|nr:uncharacterized protein LOC8066975 [Sorghum bicolor]XP_021301380.1 uncharacterized protein LOC8066975 [Sorghum bicolor]EES16653.1 hypothetical protein SORBI_3008G038100 [Sorghum bicolor]|eukprot:XP_002442815.1 uncharacterized protein LOC8066975 [Sorghum bicolor]